MEFEFDVAFTFLDRDEALVRRIRELLGTEVACFFAPERQQDLVGTDGLESFCSAYRRRSRTVAIMYRHDWGATRWTAIEQQAIKDRFADLALGISQR